MCSDCGEPVEQECFEVGRFGPYVHVTPSDHPVKAANFPPRWSEPNARGISYGSGALTLGQFPAYSRLEGAPR